MDNVGDTRLEDTFPQYGYEIVSARNEARTRAGVQGTSKDVAARLAAEEQHRRRVARAIARDMKRGVVIPMEEDVD